MPALSPLRSTFAERPGGRARERRRLEDDQLAARGCCRIVAAAESTGARSGSLVVVIGVGTHTKMASASDRRVGRRDDGQPAARAAGAAHLETSSIGEAPAFNSATRGGEGVDPLHGEAGFDERDRQRQAHVAEADHGHSTVFTHGPSRVGLFRAEDSRDGARWLAGLWLRVSGGPSERGGQGPRAEA